MKKIVVAGAGHGGISAAVNLSENGFDITVIEKKKRCELGYDWGDVFITDCLKEAGIYIEDCEAADAHPSMCYFNPSLDVKLAANFSNNDSSKVVERKHLISKLVDYAEKAGVKFIFETEVFSPIVRDDFVTGVDTSRGVFDCELLIDAAGMNSPVRNNLPESFGICSSFPEKDVFVAYRGYFSKTEDKYTSPRYALYFFHCNKPGLDWAITEKDHIDILVGGFHRLTQEDIKEALEDFRRIYPYMGDELLRGGQVTEIPMGKTLSKTVANGYAAVGDSASMTEPLSGSGIALSIHAGKILADTVIKSNADKFDEKTLWKYQYDYYKNYGESRLFNYIIKTFLSKLSSRDIDYMMKKGVITSKDIASDSDEAKKTFADFFRQGFYILLRPSSWKAVFGEFMKVTRIKSVCKKMPREYDRVKIKQWEKRYNKL